MAITAKITDSSRAIHVLEGILTGMSCDGIINIEEVNILKTWLDNHKNLIDIYPFSDAYELVVRVLEDGIIDESEQIELLDFCASFHALDGPIDRLTKDIRFLHGFMHGIIADNKVCPEELEALQNWLEFNDSNLDKWPFNDLTKLIDKILEDGIITKEEQVEFINFAANFIEIKAVDVVLDSSLFTANWMRSEAPTVKTIDMIADRINDLMVNGKTFCFTGQMKHGTRREIHGKLSEKGGIPINDVNMKTDYLVIGALSNPCWAYSTYGRKIEKVMNNRSKGMYTSILLEDDFINYL